MEHNKVYINPNFKRIDSNNWMTDPSKTTYINRHYLEEMPNRVENTRNNRKIYVNPNFIRGNDASKNISHIKKATTKHNELIENMNNVTNVQVLYKSKYSLVQNPQDNFSNKNNTGNIYDQIINSNTVNGTSEILGTKEPVFKQGLALTRSRYCIIRNKKKGTENINKNNLTVKLPDNCPISGAKSKAFTCFTNIEKVKTIEKSKEHFQTPDKVMKIKLNKYKTVPVSYLRKNTVVENKHKSASYLLKPYMKSKLCKLNSTMRYTKNRFNFIKTSTPKKSNTTLNVSTTCIITRVLQQSESTSINCGKTKLSKFKINNVPCRLFKKYGKCLRQERGNCKYLHDRKHVSLCRLFLKGICHNKECTLSHELTSKKMPTCSFYLKGMCNKENCPYLHVKLSDKTKVCQEFLKGYCENGEICPYRHVKIDEIKKLRKTAANNSKCSLKKISKSNEMKLESNIDKVTKKSKNSENMLKIDDNDKDCRYYKELEDNDASFETIKPTRCRLGNLPSFIKL